MPTSNMEHQQQNNQNTQLFTLISPVLAQSADVESSVQRNISARGVVIIVKLANEVGTAGYTPRIIIEDEDGNDIIYWSAAAALSANGTATYVLYPGAMAGAGAGVTANASIVIPRNWFFQMDYTTGTPGTDKFDVEAYCMYLI